MNTFLPWRRMSNLENMAGGGEKEGQFLSLRLLQLPNIIPDEGGIAILSITVAKSLMRSQRLLA